MAVTAAELLVVFLLNESLQILYRAEVNSLLCPFRFKLILWISSMLCCLRLHLVSKRFCPHWELSLWLIVLAWRRGRLFITRVPFNSWGRRCFCSSLGTINNMRTNPHKVLHGSHWFLKLLWAGVICLPLLILYISGPCFGIEIFNLIRRRRRLSWSISACCDWSLNLIKSSIFHIWDTRSVVCVTGYPLIWVKWLLTEVLCLLHASIWEYFNVLLSVECHGCICCLLFDHINFV